MHLHWAYVLGYLLATRYALATPEPQGNCGSCSRTGTRTGTGRIHPEPPERTVITGEAPVVDVTQFIEDFEAQHGSAVPGNPGTRQSRVHFRSANTHSRVQYINSERLGNSPFNFDWRIRDTEPATFRIRLSPLTFSTLVSQFSAVNHHVTVVSYRINWQLYQWRTDLPPIWVGPVDMGTPDEPLGPQTLIYLRATADTEQYEHVPDGAYFYRADFAREGEVARAARIYWQVTIEYIV